jgi:uncharacterized protein (UPF0548 family)
VLLFRAPSKAEIDHFLTRAAGTGHTYSEIGANAVVPPPLFTTDHNRIRLGSGAATWAKAVEAIRAWRMFSMPWIQLCWPSTPIRVGENVAVLARYLGLYWLNACRIVYTVDEMGSTQRYGFAYGTLDEHAECGEERFTVEWNRGSDEVFYDLLAFSRPNQLLVRAGRPPARRLQRRFAADSLRAMLTAVTLS